MPPPSTAPPTSNDAAPRTPPSAATLGVLALLLAATLWSLNGALIKLINQDDVHGVVIACLRSLLGGLIFLPFAWPRRASLRAAPAGMLIAAIVIFTLMTAAFVIANTQTDAASAILLQYTAPAWVFLLSPLLLRERPSAREFAALAIAMLGVLALFIGRRPAEFGGLLLGLLSGVGFGGVTLTLRWLRRVPPEVVAAMNALGSGLLLLGPAAAYGALSLSARQWGALALMALVQFTLPYFFYSWALQRVAAHRAAVIVLLEVVLNPVWTYLAVGEAPPPAVWIGGPLIVVGVAAALRASIARQH